MKLLILLLLLSPMAQADILYDIMFGSSVWNSPSADLENSRDNQDSTDDFDEYGDEAEHYSWDNLYLCHWCGVEVIVDPYADAPEEEDEDW
jgi:hypothetical protein